jgi:hypothetical protein
MRRLLIVPAALAAFALTPAGALAAGPDRNHNNLPDRWERQHSLSVKTDQSNGDRDRDGLTNLVEFRARTSPRRKDSDRDGLRDGREDRDRDSLTNRQEQVAGTDPGAADTDSDGVRDGDELIGRVVSFANGVLTLQVAGGETVSGKVDASTEVKCDDDDGYEDQYMAPDPRPAPVRAAHDDGDRSDDDHGDDDHGDDDAEDESGCGPDALVAGAIVHEADVRLTSAGLVFEEIELVTPR